MAERQATLFSSWQSRAKQASVSLVEDSESDSEVDPTQFESTLSDDVHDCGTTEYSSQRCVAQCCTTDEEAFQPVDKPTLSMLLSKQRNFQSKWYKEFPCLTICIMNKKVLPLWYIAVTVYLL